MLKFAQSAKLGAAKVMPIHAFVHIICTRIYIIGKNMFLGNHLFLKSTKTYIVVIMV